ncbi:oxidoreductase [Vagococcus acidifermentans]|nr:FAD-dependent oxidoreductase [Vagococcus acidifermentans]
MREFANLEKPITIRGITFKNRIMAAPVGFVWPDPWSSMPDAHTILNHEDRARGGAAVVTLGETAVSRTRSMRRSDGDVLVPDEERLIYPAQAWLKLTDSIIRHGAIPNIQLFHAGEATEPKWIHGQNPIGPTGYTRDDGVTVEEMDEEMMNTVADEFAEAAFQAKFANFPMVMLHGAHGWLLAQFFSKLTNKRTDKYGGSLENRARFPLMVVKRIRERCGEDFIIEYRMSGDEHLDGGSTLDEAVEFGKMLEEYVDILHISSGSYYASRQYTFPTIFTPHGCNLHLAEAFKKGGIKVPIASVGAFWDPELMDQAIAEGKADFVAVSRQIAADPMFPRKIFTGFKEEVRPCTRCINCLGNKYVGRNECDVNPIMGNEIYTIRTPDVKEKRKVLVVGGGPGGMNAALTAAQRGHEVILAEKSDQLGGNLKFTDYDLHKGRLKDYKDYLIRQVKNERIDVRYNTNVNQAYVEQEEPYALIVAVGAEKVRPNIKGIDKKHVMYAIDAYYHQDSIGDKVVMIGGGLSGCEVGLHFADSGKEVTVIEMTEELAAGANVIHRAAVLEMMEEKTTYYLNSEVVEITDTGVLARDKKGNDIRVDADTVIYCVGTKRKEDVVEHLRSSRYYKLFFPIGDCVPGSAITSKNIKDAVHGGYFAAMDII